LYYGFLYVVTSYEVVYKEKAEMKAPHLMKRIHEEIALHQEDEEIFAKIERNGKITLDLEKIIGSGRFERELHDISELRDIITSNI
jgi:hypothetical protein